MSGPNEKADGDGFSARSDVGHVRSRNEDTFRCYPSLRLFVVADGMGGHDGGDRASTIACDEVGEFIEASTHGWSGPMGTSRALAIVRESFVAANRRVRRENTGLTGKKAIGTTLSLAWLVGDHAYFGNVGDTRIYHVDARGDLTQLSDDHTLERQHLDGGLDPAHAMKFRNVLTQSVGTAYSIEPRVGLVQLLAGESILICSDGLYGSLADTSIGAIIGGASNIDIAADELMAAALSEGGSDNLTLVLVRH